MTELKAVAEKELLDIILAQSPDEAPWVFDCDGTLIDGDIAEFMAWALLKNGLAHYEQMPPEWDDFKGKPFDFADFKRLLERIRARLGTHAVYEWEALLQAGWPHGYLVKMGADVVEHAVAAGELRFNKPISELARLKRSQAWVVSGSPQAPVAGVASHLGIPNERVLGTLLETVDGIYAPRIAAPGVIWQELKRLALDENGVSRPWFVAGDTVGDWEMLQIASHWAWLTVWDERRHRGVETRELVEDRLLGDKWSLPKSPGLYTTHLQGKNWVFEVKE